MLLLIGQTNQKKFRVNCYAELFLFAKTDVCLNVEEAEREAHTKSRQRLGKNFCCNFFATPTRLADGLGTKDYPRVY